jgi:hypothetical protein
VGKTHAPAIVLELSVAISFVASASEPFALKLPPMKNLLRAGRRGSRGAGGG